MSTENSIKTKNRPEMGDFFVMRLLLSFCYNFIMKSDVNKKLKDGAECEVVAGTHAGKSGTVHDINTSKTDAITITVRQKDGERFKTLAKNVAIIA